jgi:hypothetical protein
MRPGRSEGSYRDETASLVAENARLRAELVHLRHPRRRLGAAVAIVVADVATAMALRPWFNGGSDVRFWAACAIVAALGLAAVACALGALPRRRVRP